MTAKFVYWWPGAGDNGEAVAMYRDEKGSDIAAETLLESGQPVPLSPTFQTWKRLIIQGLRCRYCWAETNGHDDFVKHSRIVHSVEQTIQRHGGYHGC